MVELEQALRSLVEHPDRLPDPIEELERRVSARRQRRTRRWGVALVALVALVGSLSALAGGRDRDTVVHTGPGDTLPGPPATVDLKEPRVEADIPSGWQKLFAEGDRLVVGTEPLTEQDLELALLARDDVAFEAFPADGVLFVVGGDRLAPKYRFGEGSRSVTNGTEVVQSGIVGTPGPAYGLGEEKVLAGRVRVRRGDIPQSTVLIAAYAGPSAPREAMVEAEKMAASVKLRPLGAVPPPPPGSRPGFDKGQPSVADDRMKTVATTKVAGVDLTLRTGDGCAVVLAGFSTQSPLAGGCTERPDGAEIAPVASTLTPRPPPIPASAGGPGPSGSLGMDYVFTVVARAGSDVRRIRALLVDGRTVDAAVDEDGWALVVSTGRVYLLEALDGQGRVIGEAAVR